MALNSLQRIALTPGEPAGIGPDLCIQLAQQDLSRSVQLASTPLSERSLLILYQVIML